MEKEKKIKIKNKLDGGQLAIDRPDLSSERAPNKDKTAKFRQNIWSQVPQ
jgi:hypothetical protein